MSKTLNTDLQHIPGVGSSISQDLMELGFSNVQELTGKNPQKMYDDLIALRGEHQDRCILYVFRCAVYFAENTKHDPELLKWWNWKDQA